MSFYFNPLDTKCKYPRGAVKFGEEICFTLTANADFAKLFIREDKSGDLKVFNGEKSNEKFSFKITNLPVGLYWYVFEIDGYLYGRDDYLNLVYSENVNWFQLSIYNSKYTVPSWFQGGLIYQIFPDRFYKKGNVTKLKDGQILRKWGEQPYYKQNKDLRNLY